MKTLIRTVLISLISFLTLSVASCRGSTPTFAPTELPTFSVEQQVLPTPTQPYTVYMPFTLPGNPGTRMPGQIGVGTAAQVQVQVSAQELRVNENLTVTGVVVGIGMPYYYLYVLDEGQQNAPPLVMVTYANELRPQEGVSQVLELVSAEGQANQAKFVLRAKAPGVAGVSVQATGEVRDANGAFVMSGAGSDPVQITVNP